MIRQHEFGDHRDGNTMDNRRSNLRSTNRSGNNQNRGADRRNTTGVKGVSFDVSRGDYKASVAVNGKRQQRRFATLDQAASWTRITREELHGAFANHGEIK